MEWASDYAYIWESATREPHLVISYTTPRLFTTIGGDVLAEQILVALPQGRLPAQPMTRVGQAFVAYEKCDGYTTVQFACDPRLEHLGVINGELGVCSADGS